MLQDSRNRTRGADARRREAEALRPLAQAQEEEAKAAKNQNKAAILRLMHALQGVARVQQSRDIEEASAAVRRMAGEITDVSKSANESADVARQSVAAAEQGA